MQPLSRWKVLAPHQNGLDNDLAVFPRVQQRMLSNRGIFDRDEAYLYLRQSGPLHSPFLLDGMQKAVDFINRILLENRKIAVYGDYDVDGVTASALLIQVLRKLGADAISYIPNRFEEGYGVNQEALHHLQSNGIALIITVDCGIRSPKEVMFAKSLGMEMIITDHHEPGEEIPDAVAVICPKKPGDNYPFKYLAGVGLAFKLADALIRSHPEQKLDARDWLDLVAIGTVADVVPLTGENRCLVKSGLDLLRKTDRPAVQALSEVSQVFPARISSGTIGFGFGPRLNAAGRLETADQAFRLMMSETLSEARLLAAELNDKNRQRQEVTRAMQAQAINDIGQDPLPMVAASAHNSYNRGVVGLAASKVAEHYYRPAIVGAIEDGMIHASCRSIEEFNMVQALDQCAELMVKYGGHAMAAGLTVSEENWPLLIERMNMLAAKELEGTPLIPSLTAEMELTLDYLRWPLLDEIAEFEPFGAENREPIFLIRNLSVVSSKLIGGGEHLSLKLKSNDNAIMDGVAFRQGNRQSELPGKIDVMGKFNKNAFRGQETLQLVIQDMRSAASL